MLISKGIRDKTTGEWFYRNNSLQFTSPMVDATVCRGCEKELKPGVDCSARNSVRDLVYTANDRPVLVYLNFCRNCFNSCQSVGAK